MRSLYFNKNGECTFFYDHFPKDDIQLYMKI